MKQKEQMEQYLMLTPGAKEGQLPIGQSRNDVVYPKKAGLEPGR